MKKATSLTLHNTSEGKRISVTYIEVDEQGRISGENARKDFLLLDGLHDEQIARYNALFAYAESMLE